MESAVSPSSPPPLRDDFGRIIQVSKQEEWAKKSEKYLKYKEERERNLRGKKIERRKAIRREKLLAEKEKKKGPEEELRRERRDAWNEKRSDAGRMHKCSHCNFMGTRRRLRRHLIEKHNENIDAMPRFVKSEPIYNYDTGLPEPHRCVLCSRTFSDWPYLKIHIATAHPQKEERQIFSCSLCSYSTSQSDLLLEHQLKRHVKSFAFECKTCALRFNTARELRIHESSHGLDMGQNRVESKTHTVEQEDNSAPQNEKVISYPVPLPSTGMNRPVDPVKPYRCPSCARDFKTQRLLAVHQRRVHLKLRKTKDADEKKIEPKAAIEHTRARREAARKKQTVHSVGLNLIDKAMESTTMALQEADIARRKRKQKLVEKDMRERFEKVLQNDEDKEDKLKFSCRICARQFKLEHHRNLHEERAHRTEKVEKKKERKRFSCGICTRTFLSEHHMLLHRKNAHKNENTSEAIKHVSNAASPEISEASKNVSNAASPEISEASKNVSNAASPKISKTTKHVSKAAPALRAAFDERATISIQQSDARCRNASVETSFFQNLYKCSQCLKTFQSKRRLTLHIETNHTNRKDDFSIEASRDAALALDLADAIENGSIFSPAVSSVPKVDKEEELDVMKLMQAMSQNVPEGIALEKLQNQIQSKMAKMNVTNSAMSNLQNDGFSMPISLPTEVVSQNSAFSTEKLLQWR
eukprot:g5951.t1